MEKELYPNTFGEGTRKYITGVENLEPLLAPVGEKNYSFHDSRIPWFYYDEKSKKLDVEIHVLGSKYVHPADKDIFIHFCFENVLAFDACFDGWHDIYYMTFTEKFDHLECEFDTYYMKVSAEHLTISPIELRSIKEDNKS